MTSLSARSLQDGLAAAHAGETARALEIAEAMLARDPRDVHAFQIIGFAHFTQGRSREALDAFLRANQLAPNQPAILNWIGLILKERGDFQQARSAFEKALRVAPQNPECLANLAEALALLRQRDSARRAFEQAANASPPNPTILARAARFFEQSHDIQRARSYAERALALEPGNEVATIALAEVESREGAHEAVIARLSSFASKEAGNRRNHSKLFHLLAEAYDRTGRYDEAFEAYQTANDLQRALYAERAAEENSPVMPKSVARLIEFFSEEDVSKWTRHQSLAGPSPVFMVGFTRSGTTWLDQILSSHPDIVVMEEEDNLVDVWREFLLTRQGLERLAGLSQEEVEACRRAYWRRAKEHLASDADKTVIIDKTPLNTIQLGLIYRLFPEARIIFVIRDPRDSVLSNFQQHFAINAGMFQFLSLESAAAYYDQVMSLGRLYREKCPLRLIETHYEALVADLESATRPIIDFLGLAWSPSVLAYDEMAKKRAILTPSLRQVVKKPYASSIGKWRHYEKHLRPVLPKLEKWAEIFGYEVNRD